MSTSSDSSLTELPQPYDISSAVSKALRIKSAGKRSNERKTMRPRAVSYPTTSGYLTAYDFPAHRCDGDCYLSPVGYYCPPSNNLYQYYGHPSSAPPASADPQQFLYPHHYTAAAVHPCSSPPTPAHQVEIDAWGESTALSICNSSSEMLESQMDIEQLDRFCKYIDSNSDDEYIVEKSEDGPEDGLDDYGCFISGSLTSRLVDSPPKKKKRKSMHSVALSGYYDEDMDGGEELLDWKVELENSSMWREFDRVGTEMVITKAGRRMFPTLSFNVSGLDPKETYSVKLDILTSDSRRYKYLQSEWVAVGRSDKKQIYCEYEHPDSPNSGSYWMDKIVAFKMVKLTNNKSTKCSDQIILNSMHKYIPCMKIMCQSDGCSQSYSFPETTFIAVTAYQSTGVTQLKINNNPYARAFRESIPSTGALKTGRYHHRQSSDRDNSLSPNHNTGDGSRDTTPASSPRHQKLYKPKGNCNSTVSVESGFESDTAIDKRRDSTSLSLSTHPFASSSLMTSYWADENSLWNPDLITPDSLMDSTSSFSSPYLEESTHHTLESDVRGRKETDKAKYDALPELNMGMGLATVEAAIPVDDDVFF